MILSIQGIRTGFALAGTWYCIYKKFKELCSFMMYDDDDDVNIVVLVVSVVVQH